MVPKSLTGDPGHNVLDNTTEGHWNTTYQIARIVSHDQIKLK